MPQIQVHAGGGMWNLPPIKDSLLEVCGGEWRFALLFFHLKTIDDIVAGFQKTLGIDILQGQCSNAQNRNEYASSPHQFRADIQRSHIDGGKDDEGEEINAAPRHQDDISFFELA